jgi:hypothetical protein
MKFVMARLGDGWVWNGKRYDDEGTLYGLSRKVTIRDSNHSIRRV